MWWLVVHLEISLLTPCDTDRLANNRYFMDPFQSEEGEEAGAQLTIIIETQWCTKCIHFIRRLGLWESK